MSKHKHRKKSKKLSSSSSGVDEKVTQEHCLSKGNDARRKESHIHDRQQQKESFPFNKDDPKSHRPVKKAVYKLPKTPDGPVEKEGQYHRTKMVDYSSREKTSSRQPRSDLSGKSPFTPMGQTVESGPSRPWCRPSKDAHHQPTERTAKHDPSIKSSQEFSRKSILPAEYKRKPPPLPVKTSPIPANRKRQRDTAGVSSTTTSSSSSSSSSSAKKSKAKVGWKPLDQPHKDERGGDAPGPEASAVPHRTTRWTSASTTSEPKPKRPTLASGQDPVAPGPHRVQGAGGPPLTPPYPAVHFKILKKPTFYEQSYGNKGTNERTKAGVSLAHATRHGRSSRPTDSSGSSRMDRKQTVPVQSVLSTAVERFPSPPRAQGGCSTAPHQPTCQRTNTLPPCKQNTRDEGASVPDDTDHEMQVLEALHLARSEQKLDLSVDHRYGDLSRMDTDTPDDGEDATLRTSRTENGLIVVLDTNILLSHLDYVKKIRSHGLGGMGFALVLVPWVVLQELDSLKDSNRMKGSIVHLVTPAVHFIHTCLKTREPRLWGQSMQQALDGNRHLNAENNDDKILQCCLQYQTLYPESALILCTNDKNLCSKALLSGVKALCKADLEEESGRLCHASLPATTTTTPTHQPPGFNPNPTPTPPPRRPHPAQHSSPGGGSRWSSHGSRTPDRENTGGGGGQEAEAQGKRVSLCVAQLEGCLKEALSHILEVEMKAAYHEIWKDVVHVKPPWELPDVIQCMRKHWIAVFGYIVPRTQLQAVDALHDFFTPGKTVEQASLLAVLRVASGLLAVFGRAQKGYGGRVSSAARTLLAIQGRLLAPPAEHVPDEPLVGDAVMSDHTEEKQATPPQVSHQEVWALFENIWANVCQTSSAVFEALHFDPGTMQRTRPEGEGPLLLLLPPPPPEDALACLHSLLPTVTQLLQSFSRFLSSDMGMEEGQALLSFIHASQLVSITILLNTGDLVMCFSQQEYREKLRLGGAQLMELKGSLEQCVVAMTTSVANTTWP